MATKPRTPKTTEPRTPSSKRAVEHLRPTPNRPPEDLSSTGRDEKLIGAERFPRKGDDEESS